MNGARSFSLVFLLSLTAGIVILIPRSPPPGFRPGSPALPFRPEPPRATVVVPTLDAPLPEGKNAAWSASFQVAWQRLKSEVAGAPIQLDGAEAVAASLNAAIFPASDLPDEDVFVAAGRGPAALRRIQAAMEPWFPNAASELAGDPEGLAAFAYIKADVRIDPPFFATRDPFRFTCANGATLHVNAFGLRDDEEDKFEDYRKRVAVYHFRGIRKEPPPPAELTIDVGDADFWEPPKFGPAGECILDPCRTSSPHQLILAMVPRRRTLGETWDVVASKLRAAGAPLGPKDTLLIPNVRCETVQDFGALAGKTPRNRDASSLRLGLARQAIDFRLDLGGAHHELSAMGMAGRTRNDFHFNRPFLIALRKRGASNPFFLLWVDNPELLK